nr:hypothetical protein [Tanacetum cinerariifolium]
MITCGLSSILDTTNVKTATTTETIVSLHNPNVDNCDENPVRIIPGHAGIVQAVELHIIADIQEGGEDSVMSTQSILGKLLRMWASKGSKSSWGDCGISKSWITYEDDPIRARKGGLQAGEEGTSLSPQSNVMSFMIQRIDGEFNFLLEGGLDENQGSLSAKSVNNETPMIDVKPISTVHPLNVSKNIVNSYNTSPEEDELSPVGPFASPKAGEESKATGNLMLMLLERVVKKGLEMFPPRLTEMNNKEYLKQHAKLIAEKRLPIRVGNSNMQK